MNKLKPCPFCGSEDLRSVQLYESNDEHYIACNECNSHGDDGLTLLHAIKNWNKRAKQHCTQCESKKENPWCSNCREKNCVVSSDGTCEMIRRYLKPRCVHCKVSEQNLDLIAEVERLKSEKQKLLDALRPVAIVGNRLINTGSLNKYEFLAPSGYTKAYEVYNEVTK